jgi:hypothetical protein
LECKRLRLCLTKERRYEQHMKNVHAYAAVDTIDRYYPVTAMVNKQKEKKSLNFFSKILHLILNLF